MAHTTSGSEGENLSRIKDILFGEDLQSIEQKLGTVKDDNSLAYKNLKDELDNRLKDIELLIADINLDVKNEKLKFEKLINDNTEQVNNKITSLEDTITQAINKLKEDHEVQLNNLNKSKISKEALAELLIGLAEKLNK